VGVGKKDVEGLTMLLIETIGTVSRKSCGTLIPRVAKIMVARGVIALVLRGTTVRSLCSLVGERIAESGMPVCQANLLLYCNRWCQSIACLTLLTSY
jgi:hypothetical protein